MKTTIYETKKIIDKIPRERLTIAKVFLQWLSEEKHFSQKEMKKIIEGEKQIADGECAAWRDIAKTI